MLGLVPQPHEALVIGGCDYFILNIFALKSSIKYTLEKNESISNSNLSIISNELLPRLPITINNH
jgi:hypothetical protein